MSIELISKNRMFGGEQGVYRHESKETKTAMQFAVFVPEHRTGEKLAALWFLSGLTCSEENVTVKAGAQRYAAEQQMILIAPDTSPRGAAIKGEDEEYDFGSGAGFYLNATQSPWDKNYRMYSYILEELQQVIVDNFPVDVKKQGITGHSMGGHGALTMALKNPDLYRSVSAFAPICSPTQCPWGHKALAGYLGDDQASWAEYDAVRLIESGHKVAHMLVDQGSADNFLTEQLKPELLKKACSDQGIDLQLNNREGYDHSYYFIASFIGEHIRYHADRLNA